MLKCKQVVVATLFLLNLEYMKLVSSLVKILQNKYKKSEKNMRKDLLYFEDRK